MFELNLKNTVLRSILKSHYDRWTTTQVIVLTRLQKYVFSIFLVAMQSQGVFNPLCTPQPASSCKIFI
jgi:hypothetical protein